MARKLKGKSGSKGLKAALAQHKLQDNLIQQQKKKQLNADRQKAHVSKKTMRQAAVQKQREASVIPFSSDETLLLIGEGDFSFAKSIIEQSYIKPENLIATSYDASITELNLKYPNTFQSNYDFLVQEGVKILFQTDATKLVRSMKISKHTPWSKIMGPEWRHKYLNNIMFNFPHTGKGIKDQDRNIRDHQELVFGYFDSSKQLFSLVNSHIKGTKNKHTQGYDLEKTSKNSNPDGISPEGYGKILLTVFAGEPYDSWQIKTLAKDNRLMLDKSSKFIWENYPEYHHKRTNSEQNTTKPAHEREARTYIFKNFERKRNYRQNKKNQENDEEQNI
ncbi:similar to Saccharomyces cerevisiae YIL096C Putative protein of unknown function [Maudiozyma barnettii]|uniref:25S rRNA (uridine-N(3))-methyltransferase BMT5-like domain-containing protein n=1 Tax=Maudiozyma barnettii TaxID=61262 RepID=A0A8H2ZG12_9SACH|nr:25S rRNA (uracil2634-N3)-methyltransferase [Kazachstania barnettii]CAB4252859.1 similar to Saccharomyces cerevisiae YIL096C Putative protein of unknown function [Kazachstania barnettii]CAD1780654.1 similar to Saccharomyces cerevisiae YIL096C Putative protein of unknown function [Kazachstania barnettii]